MYRIIQSLKKHKKLTISVLILLTIGYFVFWPRYTFEIFGYEEVKLENEHSQWWINVYNSGPGYDNIGKINIFGNPYTLSIMHDNEVKIDRVDILKNQKIILTLTDKKQIDRQASTTFHNIQFDYHEYELLIYYSIFAEKEQIIHSIKIPLKTDYVKEKVSWMYMAQGI